MSPLMETMKALAREMGFALSAGEEYTDGKDQEFNVTFAKSCDVAEGQSATFAITSTITLARGTSKREVRSLLKNILVGGMVMIESEIESARHELAK